jgi:hypothetical protein
LESGGEGFGEIIGVNFARGEEGSHALLEFFSVHNNLAFGTGCGVIVGSPGFLPLFVSLALIDGELVPLTVLVLGRAIIKSLTLPFL